jgi:hypothetical protein
MEKWKYNNGMDSIEKTKTYIARILDGAKIHDKNDVVERMYLDVGQNATSMHPAEVLLCARSLCIQPLGGESGDGDLQWQIGLQSEGYPSVWIDITYDESTARIFAKLPATPELLETAFFNGNFNDDAAVHEYVSEQLDPLDFADVFKHLSEDCTEYAKCVEDADRIERHPMLSGLLRDAAMRGHAGGLTAALNLRADANSQDHFGNSSLHIAAATGHEDLIPLLVQRGACVNELNKKGQSALHLAAENKDSHACLALMVNGADPKLIDAQGHTAQDIMRNASRPQARVRDEARCL